MATETHVRGDTPPLDVTLRQADVTPYDLSGCEVALHINTAAAGLTEATLDALFIVEPPDA